MQNSKIVRVGIDARPLVEVKSGVSTYIFYLLEALVKQNPTVEFYLYVPSDHGEIGHFKQYSNVTIRGITFCNIHVKRAALRHLFLPFVIWKDQIDFFWGTVQTLPFFVPSKTKTILTVYDFVYLFFPETMATFHHSFSKVMCTASLKKADYLLPISRGTADKLKELYDLSSYSVVIPPQKPNIYYREKKELLPFLSKAGLEYNNYIVTVGTIEPRKNFIELVEIYKRLLGKLGPEQIMPLVIIGGGGWKNGKIREVLEEAEKKFPGQFRTTGFVDDALLSFYLSGARYYISLSLYEGYGMPIAEARRCRTPPICPDIPEMREAAENQGIFLKRDSIESALEELLIKGEATEEKPPLPLSYPTTEESAAIIGSLFRDCL